MRLSPHENIDSKYHACILNCPCIKHKKKTTETSLGSNNQTTSAWKGSAGIRPFADHIEVWVILWCTFHSRPFPIVLLAVCGWWGYHDTLALVKKHTKKKKKKPHTQAKQNIILLMLAEFSVTQHAYVCHWRFNLVRRLTTNVFFLSRYQTVQQQC